MRIRSFWGWGHEGQGPTREDKKGLARAIGEHFDLNSVEIKDAPEIDSISLRKPRVGIPDEFSDFCNNETRQRASHSYGKAFRDIVRGLNGHFPNPPDIVAFPREESEIYRLLEWCGNNSVAAIPYGGGSSVVGGIEPRICDNFKGALTIDLSAFNQVIEIDDISRAARIQAGIYGPALEEQLRPKGFTLRHFPQSFEFSTLGGWIATRAGGHFATNYTHIDDFVESLRVITPRGTIESRRLPGSGAGPSPDRMFIGSEGILGIITEAWMRLQERPLFKASAAIRFEDFEDATEAVRQLSQAGLFPSNCRVLNPAETLIAGVGDGSATIVLLGFESADHAIDTWMKRAVQCCRDHSGQIDSQEIHYKQLDREEQRKSRSGGDEGTSEAWRRSFLSAPYLRDALVSLGMITETFETAITWDRFPTFHRAVTEAVESRLNEICGGGRLSCRFTHVYPDGPAPYYTVLAPSSHGNQLAQWQEIKDAAGAAIIENGGTITHHHAVGRDHRPWYDQQRPELFASAITAAKGALDPVGILNPGVLID